MRGSADEVWSVPVRTQDPEHFGRVLQGARMEYMPRPGHAFRAELSVLRLGWATVQRVEIGACVSRGAIESGIAGLILPLHHPPGATIANGIALTEDDALLVRGGADLVTSSETMRSWVSIAFPPALLAELAELLPPGTAALRIPRGAASRLRAALLAGFTAAGVPGSAVARPGEAALRELLVEALAAATPHPSPGRATREAMRVLRQAEELLRSNLERPLFRDDLCAALGVSRRKLHDAFVATVGLSPPAYLKLRRLVLARRALRAPPGGVPLVKTVALTHGFWHLGHFARDYRALFGELPSETLTPA